MKLMSYALPTIIDPPQYSEKGSTKLLITVPKSTPQITTPPVSATKQPPSQASGTLILT